MKNLSFASLIIIFVFYFPAQASLAGPYENKNPAFQREVFHFAERGGFEPPVQLPIRQFSKLLV